MILFGWWTRAAASESSIPVDGGQWVYVVGSRRHRVYPHRVRDNVWVLPGDIKSDDPALDTWEG